MPDLCHFVSKFSLGIPFFSIGRNHRNCFHLSLYHWRACSYWYLNVRGSDRWHFPLSLLYHYSVTPLSLMKYGAFIIWLKNNMVLHSTKAISFFGRNKHIISRTPPCCHPLHPGVPPLFTRMYHPSSPGCKGWQHGDVWQLKCLARRWKPPGLVKNETVF